MKNKIILFTLIISQYAPFLMNAQGNYISIKYTGNRYINNMWSLRIIESENAKIKIYGIDAFIENGLLSQYLIPNNQFNKMINFTINLKTLDNIKQDSLIQLYSKLDVKKNKNDTIRGFFSLQVSINYNQAFHEIYLYNGLLSKIFLKELLNFNDSIKYDINIYKHFNDFYNSIDRY